MTDTRHRTIRYKIRRVLHWWFGWESAYMTRERPGWEQAWYRFKDWLREDSFHD
jgi:hypothetical protein